MGRILKAGDIIREVEGNTVNSVPELQEIIARHRPGDILNVKVNRKGKERSVKVKLKNLEGETKFLAKNKKEILNILGADFEEVDNATANRLGISGGLKVNKLFAGKILRHTQMREGFIITKVDGRTVKTIDELAEILENKKGGVLLEGIYEDMPGTHYYAFGL